MESTIAVSMQDIPPEIIEIIASYLSSDDLASCFNVWRGWKSLFNSNKIWRKFCIYPEKYFKTSGCTLGSRDSRDCEEVCIWKKNYDRQKLLWENWSKKRFTKKKTDIPLSMLGYFVYFVDNCGNYWLLYSKYDDGVSVWKMDEIPIFHGKFDVKDNFGIVPVKNKLLTHNNSDYIQIFEFKPPENELVRQYRFKFNEDTIIPDDSVFVNEYVCSQRFIIVDNFLIGYCENITDLLDTYIDIWDCDSGKKVATQSIFQHSFVDYVLSSTGFDITNDFEGSLMLFESDSRRFLVNTISDAYNLCEISLFSLDKMEFVNVVARIKSSAFCKMKGDTVAIYHSVIGYTRLSQVSVYSTDGKFLAKLDIPQPYNYFTYSKFWLTLSKVIFKVRNTIYVLDIIDSENIRARSFNTNTDALTSELGYVEPKYLLLYIGELPVSPHQEALSVSVWDVDSGSKLWNLGLLNTLESCRFLFSESSVYPNKLIVHFTDEKVVSLLDFEVNNTLDH